MATRKTGGGSGSTPRYGGSFTAVLFRYEGPGGWHFAPVPDRLAPP